MNKKVLVKLASYRLAINYVLRARIKRAMVDRTPTIPVWDFNPYDNGDKFYMNNGTKGYYYRSAADMEAHAQNPNIRTRPGTSRDTYVSPVQQAGHDITQGILDEWKNRPLPPPPMPAEELRLPLSPIELKEYPMPEGPISNIPNIIPMKRSEPSFKAVPLPTRR